MNNKITIQILGWNDACDLEKNLPRLRNLPDATIRYIDNNSKDNSIETVKSILPDADIISLTKNKGFAEGNNVGFRMCDTEFIMLCNPDLEIITDNLQELMRAFEDPKIAAIQGKLLRDRSADKSIIDSAGITMTLTLNGKERGTGQIDAEQYDTKEEIDAVTGASGIYRLSALNDIAHENMEVFDKQFFAYKEDVDLGWRLRKAGYQCLYLPTVQGYHHRSLKKHETASFIKHPSLFISKIKDQRTFYSLRNWIWMVAKNATIKDALIHEIFFDARLIFFILLSLIYWPLLKVWPATLKGLPQIFNKRINQEI